MNLLTLVPILFPMLAGGILPLLNMQDNRKKRQVYVASVVIINTLITLAVVLIGNLNFEALKIGSLSILLNVDNLAKFFLVLASLLWLLATFYTFEYIKHEGKDIRFFTFFLMTLGVIMGICMSGNFFTLYLFYELMTLITYPLVTHSETPEAIKAGSKYLMYSFFGAAFALVGFVFMTYFGTSIAFTAGGVLDMSKVAGNENLVLLIFLLTVIGFGCKAGMWPLHAWLPTAHPVAPAPASALLSGVITKAGVLAIIRVIYYLYGVEFLTGSWAQIVLIFLTLFTVFMGSMLAYKEKLMKRRLAYSTVSQVSYVLFGLALMSPQGFLGALLHIIFHAVIKNVLFLSAGAIIYKTHKTYVYELRGIGKSMPITMWCFTIASLALVGIPPTAGVVSKWYLAMGGIESQFSALAQLGSDGSWLNSVGIFLSQNLGTIGAGVLLISALLTGGYLITMFVTAFFPGSDFDYSKLQKTEPNKLMTVPLVILSVCCVLFGMFPGPLVNFINQIAGPLFV